MILHHQGHQTKIRIPGLDFRSDSIDNFTLLDNEEGTYFRVQIGKCTPLHLPAPLMKYSAKDTSYLPDVEVGLDVSVDCVCCLTTVVASLCFRRILPLPSDSWDASEMFCHAHDAPTSISPRPGDLLYGPYNFILSVHGNLLANVILGSRLIYCETCNAWLGTRGAHFYTLWNSTVRFSPVRCQTVNTTESMLENETPLLTNLTLDDEENNGRGESGVILQADKGIVHDSNKESISKYECDRESKSNEKNQKSPHDTEHKLLSSMADQVFPATNVQQERDKQLKNSPPDSSREMDRSLPRTAKCLHQKALHDFISVVRDNIGINSKILIHCQVSEDTAQYILLWVMDRNLSLYIWNESGARITTVMKVLYSYAKKTPAPHWENDLSLAQVSVSKSMFLSAVQHMRDQEKDIPAPFRTILEMNVSYIVLE